MMTYQKFKEYYSEALEVGYKRAKKDGAAEDETFKEWCKGEYEFYQRDPDDYYVAYNGIFD
ncbi:MAG: hypothetical protein ACE5JO_07340 [Candidatus Binatia bacterium]